MTVRFSMFFAGPQRLILAAVLITGLSATTQAAQPEGVVQQDIAAADNAFADGRYTAAATAYQRALQSLTQQSGEARSPVDQHLREQLGLSRFLARDVAAARSEFRGLCARYPSYQPDPDALTPDAVAFIRESEGCSKKVVAPSTPTNTPTPPISATAATQPIAQSVTRPSPADERFRWYYLAPLGVGQYLAGSPVRGTVSLVGELSMISLNVAGAVMLANQRLPGGFVRDTARASEAQLITNIGFVGLAGFLVLSLVDALVFEP